MRKIIFLIISGLLFVNFISAQKSSSDYSSKIVFGLKAGVNMSNVFDVESDEFVADPKLGFAAGGFLSIPVGKILGVQPELLFSQKGYKRSGTFLGSSYELKHTTSYLDIPLMFAFKPIQFVTVLAGPEFSFLLSQKDVFTSGSLTVDQEQQFENTNIRKNVLCFTGGVDINMNKIVLGARAGWDIQNNNGDGTTTDPRYKNVWYQVTAGFRF